MQKIVMVAAQVNPFSGDKFLVVQIEDENAQFQSTVTPYDELSPADQQFVDQMIQFGESKLV